MSADLIGASVWETELYDCLTTHAKTEQELAETYRSASAESESPPFQYLVEMIIDDDFRHRLRFEELAQSVRNDAEVLNEEPQVPRLNGWGPNPQRVADLIDRLLERERSEARDLKEIEKKLKDVKNTTLWPLVVRMMEEDSAKHIEMLTFVKDHVR